ncbi:SAM-dependent methyltransferase [Mycolicibacterium smegmatis]|uniref:SAM-dependent methyltransferase n=1 Tax=Mycolicibacterium smegmatis TaxID=1772 RepID=UPI0020A42964|nr:SAM-dependent methyltransferase [Mycolicibacterium smegmatis]MCP2627218.1 SAM-dependent methyltransferase [Mycolicibacterium smegmatis]
MGVSVERTTVGPTLIVAIDQYDERTLVPDPWAVRILPRRWRVPAVLSRFKVVRNAMIAATENSVRGGWASLLCRKRYIDDVLAGAASGGGLDAVVILGAGYDTRAHRVLQLSDVPVWEVDLPDNIAAKTAALQRCFGPMPANVTPVSVDLEHGDLIGSLTGAGFDTGMRTAFVWESVTMYLTEPVVRRTLQATSACAAGSHLVFTHFRKDFVDGVSLYGAQKARERFADKLHLWRYGIDPEDVAGVLAEYGWRETEQAGASEYRKRYLAPAGRSDPLSEIERAVWAQR